MDQVLYSAGSLLFSILLCSALAFNPLTVKAQLEAYQPKLPPQAQDSPHPPEIHQGLTDTPPIASAILAHPITFEEAQIRKKEVKYAASI